MGMKVRLSALMFIQFFIWGAWYVTMGTYLGKTLHFTGVQIGLAYGTAALATIISPFFIGTIADRFFSANRVVAVLNLLGVVLLYFLTKVETFSLFFPLLLLYTICYMPTTALANSITLSNLKNPTQEFSRIRLLGSIGWIIAGVLVSLLKIEDQSTPFLVAAVSSVIGAGLALWLPYHKPERQKSVSWVQMIGLDAFRLLKDKQFAIVFFFSMLTCIPLAFYDSFTNLFLNSMQVDNAAAAMSTGQIAEIVCLLIFPLAFAKLRYKGSIGLAIGAWTTLYALLAVTAATSQTFWVYFALPLHGLCFTFFFVSGQLFVDERSPLNLRNSAQGLIALGTYGMGKYIGTFVSGRVVDHYTIDGVQQWTSIWIVPAIMVGVIFIGFFVCFREKGAKR